MKFYFYGLESFIAKNKEVKYSHNSSLADSEPSWGSISKSSLPRIAFADMGEPNKKSTWRYPHHFIKDGKLYLHKGGLNSAWAHAHGARSGEKASQSVLGHLSKHRKAIGAGKD